FSELLEQSSLANGLCAVECGCQQEQALNLLYSFFEAKRTSRVDAIQNMAHLIDLPNINKPLVNWLEALGYTTPSDFLKTELEHTAKCIASHSKQDASLKPEEAARLKALCHYLQGNPAASWREFIH
ncbi:MAG: hypothetical protein R3194_02350, partial [Limnobacter sp.]|nr:hypothetical protein [Limnobacter sp.]